MEVSRELELVVRHTKFEQFLKGGNNNPDVLRTLEHDEAMPVKEYINLF